MQSLTPDESRADIERLGWTVIEERITDTPTESWKVYGSRGDASFAFTGRTRDEVWRDVRTQVQAPSDRKLLAIVCLFVTFGSACVAVLLGRATGSVAGGHMWLGVLLLVGVCGVSTSVGLIKGRFWDGLVAGVILVLVSISIFIAIVLTCTAAIA